MEMLPTLTDANLDEIKQGLSQSRILVVDEDLSVRLFTGKNHGDKDVIFYRQGEEYFIARGGYNLSCRLLFEIASPIIISALKKGKDVKMWPPDKTLEEIETRLEKMKSILYINQGGIRFTIPGELKRLYEAHNGNLKTTDSKLDDKKVHLIEKCIEGWIETIKNIYGSVNQEERRTFSEDKKFWQTLNGNLMAAEELYRSPMVTFCLELLNQTNKFLLYTSLQSYFEQTSCRVLCNAFNAFYEDLDFEPVDATVSFDEIEARVLNILSRLNTKTWGSIAVVRKSVLNYVPGYIRGIVLRNVYSWQMKC